MKSLNRIKLLLFISIFSFILVQFEACGNQSKIKKMQPIPSDVSQRGTTKVKTKTSPNHGSDQAKIDSIKRVGKKGG